MINEKESHKILITRILTGEANEADRYHFVEWLSESEENKELFNQYKTTWQYKPVETDKIIINRSAAWQKINDSIELAELDETSQIPQTRSFRIDYRLVSGIAAAMLIFAAIYFMMPQQQSELLVFQAENRMTDALLLPDGSAVHLDERSSLTYPGDFRGKFRNVQLSGNAYFDVAHNSDKPFAIELERATVTVLGTSFYITQNQASGKTEIAVVSGSVSFHNSSQPGNKLVLQAGEKGILDHSSDDLTKGKVTDYNFLAWKTGKLEFNQTPLSEVFNILEKTYQISIINRGDQSGLRLTARFTDEDADNIFKTIGLLFGLKVESEGSVYIIH